MTSKNLVILTEVLYFIVLTGFSGKLARIFVAPQTVSLFYENKMCVSAKEFHSSVFSTNDFFYEAFVTFPP